MSPSASSRRTRHAVAVTAPLEQARLAAGAAPASIAAGAPAGPGPAWGRGTADPLVGDLRKGGLLPLLVLHYVAREPSYGGRLMEAAGAPLGGGAHPHPQKHPP